jgi:phosphomannomutase/phosphoglucomutase
MKINRNLFRAYDIRALAMGENPDLNVEIMEQIGKAAGTYFVRKGRKEMVCGRDGRVTSPEFQEALIKGMLSTGLNVTNVGLATSPMIYFASCLEEYDCGCTVTASHNQMEDNGVKFVDTMSHSVFADELQKFPDFIEAQDFEVGEGELKEGSVFEEFKEKLWSMVEIKKPLKVVLDTANGVAGEYARKMFEHPMIDLEVMYEEVDGTFPNHEANPAKEPNMADLKRKVLEVGADFGVGFDGDGDRIGVVDDKGQFHMNDLVLALFAEDVLGRLPGRDIIFDVNGSKVLEQHIAKVGGNPVRFRVGHSYIEEAVDEDKAILGGEISGHFYFAENYYGFDDAFLAALKLMGLVSEMDGKLSEYFDNLPKFVSTPELRISCPDDKKFELIDWAVAEFKGKGLNVREIDGAFVEFDDDSWGLFRASNTSPKTTMRFEAKSVEKVNEMIDVFYEVLKVRDEFDVEPILGLKM